MIANRTGEADSAPVERTECDRIDPPTDMVVRDAGWGL